MVRTLLKLHFVFWVLLVLLVLAYASAYAKSSESESHTNPTYNLVPLDVKIERTGKIYTTAVVKKALSNLKIKELTIYLDTQDPAKPNPNLEYAVGKVVDLKVENGFLTGNVVLYDDMTHSDEIKNLDMTKLPIAVMGTGTFDSTNTINADYYFNCIILVPTWKYEDITAKFVG